MEGIIYRDLNGVHVPFGFFSFYRDAQEAMKFVDKGFLKEAKYGKPF